MSRRLRMVVGTVVLLATAALSASAAQPLLPRMSARLARHSAENTSTHVATRYIDVPVYPSEAPAFRWGYFGAHGAPQLSKHSGFYHSYHSLTIRPGR